MIEVNIANTEDEYKGCFSFIKNMWKNKFEIDFELNLEKQYNGFINAEIYYIEFYGKIIAVVQFAKIKKGFKLKEGFIPKQDSYFLWRIGVDDYYRKQGYGTKLIDFGINKILDTGIKVIYTLAEINNIDYYSKFGFVEFGEIVNTGNTKAIHMKKEL